VSEFETEIADGIVDMHQFVLGQDATLTDLAGNTLRVKAIPNELVGFVDEKMRKLFTFEKGDSVDPFVRRGTTLRLDSAPNDLWRFVNVRNDDVTQGAWEVRADIVLERT